MSTAVSFPDALCYGYERLSAWADLLDRINVYPVADADTGTNLKISLAPLRLPAAQPDTLIHQLMMAATGNSGNIAAAFFCELIKAGKPADLKPLIRAGSTKARQAVGDPQPGTMLTVLEVLDHCLHDKVWPEDIPDCPWLIQRLEKAVGETAGILPVLKNAGVIDAGALGLFVFMEAYLCALFAPSQTIRPVTDIFPDKLAISADWQPSQNPDEFCVNTMIQTSSDPARIQQLLSEHCDSMVIGTGNDFLKVHLHTQDREQTRKSLATLGTVTSWSEEPMGLQTRPQQNQRSVHIITDAAGSITLQDARDLGITLLNSYLVMNGRSWPETACNPQDLYNAMRAGIKVTTAQASLFERQQSYLSATHLHDNSLYLCVGSVYTGNFNVAVKWQSSQDCQDRFQVLDTGAASGRLGIIALATARVVQNGLHPQDVIPYARFAMSQSQEFVFLDQLKYLAAGGRISKTKGFFGDLMHLKPIISPRPEGAVKVGVVKNRAGQLDYALEQLDQQFDNASQAMIMVQYSDNRQWVQETAGAQIQDRFPAAEVLIRPLSLTAGAHMGPGTWAVAFLPPQTFPHTGAKTQ